MENKTLILILSTLLFIQSFSKEIDLRTRMKSFPSYKIGRVQVVDMKGRPISNATVELIIKEFIKRSMRSTRVSKKNLTKPFVTGEKINTLVRNSKILYRTNSNGNVFLKKTIEYGDLFKSMNFKGSYHEVVFDRKMPIVMMNVRKEGYYPQSIKIDENSFRSMKVVLATEKDFLKENKEKVLLNSSEKSKIKLLHKKVTENDYSLQVNGYGKEKLKNREFTTVSLEKAKKFKLEKEYKKNILPIIDSLEKMIIKGTEGLLIKVRATDDEYKLILNREDLKNYYELRTSGSALFERLIVLKNGSRIN